MVSLFNLRALCARRAITSPRIFNTYLSLFEASTEHSQKQHPQYSSKQITRVYLATRLNARHIRHQHIWNAAASSSL